MKKMNRKCRREIISLLLVCVMITVLSPCNVQAENFFYKNDKDVVLSSSEYNHVIQYISEEDLELFTMKELNYVMENPNGRIEEASAIYCSSENIEGGKNNEKYLTEKEVMENFNVKNQNISTLSYSDRTDTHTTAMKKITMNMYQVDGSVKKVILKCVWLSLPTVKSYDVIAMRPMGNSATINALGANNVVGYQKYDGRSITYNYSSNNFKYTNSGVGVSVDLNDNVQSSLSVILDVSFVTTQDPFQVYGTYQHAVKNISLNNSKKYTIESGGMGNVLKFNSGYASYYDNTGGVMVKGSLDDYN